MEEERLEGRGGGAQEDCSRPAREVGGRRREREQFDREYVPDLAMKVGMI